MPSQSAVRGRTPATAPDDVGRRARQDAVARLVAGGALWSGLLLVTFWWVADGGVRDLTTWAPALTSVGRLSGLVASVLLLAQVIIMARVPVLERAFGQDRLTRIHRLVGFTSFDLMVTHVVTITWGYAAGELSRTPATLWDLVVDYPGMLLATAGTGCLFLVVVTSVKASRRALRYESWHLLHLYAYLGVGLALPHQLWTGQQFVASPARTVFWWTAWGVAAGVVLVYRVCLPVGRNVIHRLRVVAVCQEGPGVASVWLSGRRLDRLHVQAGQFMSWRFRNGAGWSRAHPYSLSAAPDGRRLRITVQAVGDGSAEILRLRPGTRAIFEGPYGRLGARARTRRKVALIGAGVGVTPLRSLAEGLDSLPGEVLLVQRFTTQPLFAAELDALARDRGLQVLYLPGERRHPDSWLGSGVGPASDLEFLLAWIPDIAERDVFVCGPGGWTDAVRRCLRSSGVNADHIHLENFAW